MRFSSLFFMFIFVSLSVEATNTKIVSNDYIYNLIPSFNSLKITNRLTNAESSITLDSLPCAMALHESMLYVVHFRGSYIHLISVPDHQVVKQVLLAECAPDDICIYQDRGYVECASGVIKVLDLHTHHFIGQFKVGKHPQEMLFQGKYAYIRCADSSSKILYVVDLLTYKTLRTKLLHGYGPITLSNTHVFQGGEQVFPLYPYDKVMRQVNRVQSWEDYIKLDLEVFKSISNPPYNKIPKRSGNELNEVVKLFNNAALLVQEEILSYLHPAEQLNLLIASRNLQRDIRRNFIEHLYWEYTIGPRIYQAICAYTWRGETEKAIALLYMLRMAVLGSRNKDKFVVKVENLERKLEALALIFEGKIWEMNMVHALNFSDLIFTKADSHDVLRNLYEDNCDIIAFGILCVQTYCDEEELNAAFKKALASNDPYARSLMYLAFAYGLWGATQSPDLARIYEKYNDRKTIESCESTLK